MDVDTTSFTSNNNESYSGNISNVGRGKERKVQGEGNRLINRNGQVEIQHVNVPGRQKLYLADHLTTLLEWKWRYIILLFSLTFLISWLVFGSLWWNMYSYRSQYFNIICIEKVDSWTSAFLFSLETQTTIGYGGRQITPDCPEGYILLVIQCIVGLIMNSTLLGLVFTKLQQPHLRQSTLLLSNTAVIAPRDGKMCFMFRVGDVRKTQLAKSQIRLLLVRKHYSSNTREITVSQHNLRVTYDTNETNNSDFVYVFSPVIICHVIDENSPLRHLTPNMLQEEEFEIVVVFEGIVEPTGNVMQARTSYVQDQIKWGHVFSKMVDEAIVDEAKSRNRHYAIDFSKFHSTEPLIALERPIFEHETED